MSSGAGSPHYPVSPQGGAVSPWDAASAVGSYTSPIPVVPTHLGHAVSSEWTKIRSVRSTMWTLGAFVVLVVGIGVIVALLVEANTSDSSLAADNPLSYGFFGIMLGCVPILTLGVMTTASEYNTGMIRTTMVACPPRARILAAKGIVFFTVAFVVTLVSTGLVAFVDVAVLTGAREPSTGEWLKSTVGVSLYIALLGLLSLAVGSLLRHSAGAITLMIGLLLAPIVIAIFMFAESLQGLREALFEYSIPSQLGVWYTTSLSDDGMSGWDPLWIALGATAVVYGAAFALLEKRDV